MTSTLGSQATSRTDRPVRPAPAGGPRGSAGRTPRRWRAVALPWITTLAVLLLAELLSLTGVLPEEIPPVSEVLVAAAQLIPTPEFLASLGLTLQQFVVGLVAGVVVGIAVGVALGAIPTLYLVTHYVLDFLRFIPSVVYLPVLILLIGATPQAAILLAAVGTTWPMLFQTYYGVVGIAPVLKDTGRVFGLTPRQRLANIVLPSVSPFIATGLRIAAAHALVVVVAVQIITAVRGLGRDIAVYATNGVYPEMYALVGVVGLLGIVINMVLVSVERRRLRWHSAYREDAS